MVGIRRKWIERHRKRTAADVDRIPKPCFWVIHNYEIGVETGDENSQGIVAFRSMTERDTPSMGRSERNGSHDREEVWIEGSRVVGGSVPTSPSTRAGGVRLATKTRAGESRTRYRRHRSLDMSCAVSRRWRSTLVAAVVAVRGKAPSAAKKGDCAGIERIVVRIVT